ncbi:MAG: hypothetical protein ABSB95_15720 [Dissulfurispiraceae bacterium]
MTKAVSNAKSTRYYSFEGLKGRTISSTYAPTPNQRQCRHLVLGTQDTLCGKMPETNRLFSGTGGNGILEKYKMVKPVLEATLTQSEHSKEFAVSAMLLPLTDREYYYVIQSPWGTIENKALDIPASLDANSMSGLPEDRLMIDYGDISQHFFMRMAKDKKKKIAGISYDEWLGPGEPAHIKEINKYSNKLIAYLDVLGIKNLIDRHRNNDEHLAIDKIEQIRKIVEDSTALVKKTDYIDYLQISDSFVFVCDPGTIILLIELLSTIQMRIISECEFLLRGAITIGDAIV